jgi:hypothetical protein
LPQIAATDRCNVATDRYTEKQKGIAITEEPEDAPSTASVTASPPLPEEARREVQE